MLCDKYAINIISVGYNRYFFVGREVRINFEIPEFTAICPYSDFPDFGTIRFGLRAERTMCGAKESEALHQFISSDQNLSRARDQRHSGRFRASLRSASR